MNELEWTEVVRVGIGDLHITRVRVAGQWRIQRGHLVVTHAPGRRSTVPLSAELVKDAGHLDDRAPTP